MSVFMSQTSSLRRTASETSNRSDGMQPAPRSVYVTIPEDDPDCHDETQGVVYPATGEKSHTPTTVKLPWKERLTQIYHDYHLRHVIPLLMLLLYCLLTATAFHLVESPHEARMLIEKESKLVKERTQMIESLMTVWGKDYLLDNARIRNVSSSIAIKFERNVGLHDPVGRAIPWDMSGALFYTTTIYTTIGYGSIAPRTNTGRMLTMLFALPGIALVLAILNDYGKLFFNIVTYLYQRSKRRVRRSQKESQSLSWSEHDTMSMPLQLALLICLGWVLLCAAVFLAWEDNWSYPSAVYFLFVSLTTIGLGDIVVEHTGMLLLFFWLIFIGLALVSMLINVIQQKIEEWLYRIMRMMKEEYEAALAMGDCPEKDEILARVLQKQPFWVQALATASDTGDKIERLTETAAVVDEVNTGVPRTPRRETPPPAEPIPDAKVAVGKNKRQSLLSTSFEDIISVVSTMSRHVAAVDDKLRAVRYDRGTSPMGDRLPISSIMERSIQTDYNDEVDISTFDVINYINALQPRSEEMDMLLANCQQFIAALSDVRDFQQVQQSAPTDLIDFTDVVDYINTIETPDEMDMLLANCQQLSTALEHRHDGEVMAIGELVEHINNVEGGTPMDMLVEQCPHLSEAIFNRGGEQHVQHIIRFINQLNDEDTISTVINQCPQLTATVTTSQPCVVKYLNTLTTRDEVDSLLAECPIVTELMKSTADMMETIMQTSLTMTDMEWSMNETKRLEEQVGQMTILEEVEPVETKDVEIQTDGEERHEVDLAVRVDAAAQTSLDERDPLIDADVQTSLHVENTEEPVPTTAMETQTTSPGTCDFSEQCSFEHYDTAPSSFDESPVTVVHVECQTDEMQSSTSTSGNGVLDGTPTASTIDAWDQTSIEESPPIASKEESVEMTSSTTQITPWEENALLAMTDSHNQTSFDHVDLADAAIQTDIKLENSMTDSMMQTSVDLAESQIVPTFELTPVDCQSTTCQTEGGQVDEEWEVIATDVASVDTQTPWTDDAPEAMTDSSTQPDRVIILHTAMQTEDQLERTKSAESIAIEFASTSSQTNDSNDESTRARPLMRFNTLARVASSFRGKPKDISVNTHDGCMQTDHMLNRESCEMQTDDSYLRIARRLNSLRSKKGSGELSGVIAVKPGRPRTMRKHAANLAMLTEHESRSPTTSAKSINERYRRNSKRRGSDGVDVVKAIWEKRSQEEKKDSGGGFPHV